MTLVVSGRRYENIFAARTSALGAYLSYLAGGGVSTVRLALYGRLTLKNETLTGIGCRFVNSNIEDIPEGKEDRIGFGQDTQ